MVRCIRNDQKTMNDKLIDWYYERLQSTGKTQSKLLWSSVFISFAALLINFDPNNAKELRLFDFHISSLQNILPALLFFILILLQGNMISMRYPIDKIKALYNEQNTEGSSSKIQGIYEIDRNLNFLDYLSFVLDKRCKRKWGALLYPAFITLTSFTVLPIISNQLISLYTNKNVNTAFLLAINIFLGVICYIFSRPLFKERWQGFIKKNA